MHSRNHVRVRGPLERREGRGLEALRGQAAVLISLGLFTLVVFTGLATNVGILVNERIRIQGTADLGAYAGAYQQAVRLNAIAGLNRSIQHTLQYCRDRLTSPNGRFGQSKVWNQCLPEGQPPSLNDYEGDDYGIAPFQLLAQIGAKPPVHTLYPPPYAQRGYPVPAEQYQCLSEVDARANDLILWCANTINYYASLIHDLNDYQLAYFPEKAGSGNVAILNHRRKGIFKAVENTVKANYPDSDVELLDRSAFSPVNNQAFMQGSVDPVFIPGSGYVPSSYSQGSYNRGAGNSMAPIYKTPTNLNYVFRCCRIKQGSQPCGPPQCGFPRGIVLPYVGPVNSESQQAYVELSSIHSYNINKGMLYLPLRVWADPDTHNLAKVDLPTNRSDSNYFGGWRSWNVMRATAVAKPFEGFVGPSFDMLQTVGINNEFYPPIIDFGTSVEGRPLLNGVFTGDPLGDLAAMNAWPYPEYRSRIAGFREPLLSTTAAPVGEDTKKLGKKMLDVLVEHALSGGIPGDSSGMDYEHTSH